eukprot:TRINITY_DN3465_c0_g1_i1.p1 TRINITY_DN3465_c0_g1~~TRINITY_DN3465_c0_g1_i1.p1  ORF type:complete len:581 (+),score=154.14 TRINITY_DN3465_c0_g1_i1:25-1743(+)
MTTTAPPTPSWIYYGKNVLDKKENPRNSSRVEIPQLLQSDGETAQNLFLSQFGEYIAIVYETKTVVYEYATWEVVSVMATGKVTEAYFSPRSQFFVTWTNLGPRVEFSLKLYTVSTGELIRGWRISEKGSCNLIQWNANEEICVIMEQKGSLNFYEAGNWDEPINRYTKAGLNLFEIAPAGETPELKIAVFTKGKNNTPSKSAILAYPEMQTPLASVSCFSADEAVIRWNSLGSAIILQTTKDLDESGKLYYGTTGLYLIRDDGFTSHVQPQTQQVPIHDVCWNPRGRQFVVIHGFMPDVSTSVFNLKCNKTRDISTETRNKLIWSSCGRILCVGGFESLTGNMSFYNVTNINQPTLIGETNAFATSFHKFSPCSQYFIAATLSPRLRIDNGIKIFTYNGELVFEENIDDLYKVEFTPNAEDAPRSKFTIEVRKAEEKKEVGIYRHPRFTQGNRALQQTENSSQRSPGNNRGRGRRPSRGRKNVPFGLTEQVSEVEDRSRKPKAKPTNGKGGNPANRKRNLKKKLVDIEKLLALKEEGKQLEANQLEKISRKSQIEEELRELDQIIAQNQDF